MTDPSRVRGRHGTAPRWSRVRQALGARLDRGPAHPAGPVVDATGGLADVTSLVHAPAPLHVAVLAHPTQRSSVSGWLDRLAGHRVTVLAPQQVPEWHLEARPGTAHARAAGLSQVGLQLRRLGRLDLVVSLLPTGLLPGEAEDQYDLFRRVFRLVARGGAYVLDRRTAPAGSELLGLERLLPLLAAVEDPASAAALRRRDAELADSVGTVVASRDLLVATKRVDHYLKLREGDVAELLPLREPELALTVLESRRALKLPSRATVTTRGGGVSPDTFPAALRVPRMSLRHYRGEIASAGSTLLFTGRSILPEAFRWHLTENPQNKLLRSVAPDFARIDSRHVPRRRLPGDYFLFDSHHSGHFGHLMTEVLSRLWGWQRAKAELPGLKVLFHLDPPVTKPPRLELELLTSYGVAAQDVVWVDEPVWLESLVAATPMWHNAEPLYVHPDIEEVWDRLTEGLLARADPARLRAERIFVSRRSPNRRCRNRGHVEQLFSRHGFEVVFPESLPLPEQAALFAGARVVAGFAGSAMFNLMYARSLQTTIVLGHSAYDARNEHLFTSVKGGRAHYFWSEPDVPQPEGEDRSMAAFMSRWRFDVEQHEQALEALLRDL